MKSFNSWMFVVILGASAMAACGGDDTSEPCTTHCGGSAGIGGTSAGGHAGTSTTTTGGGIAGSGQNSGGMAGMSGSAAGMSGSAAGMAGMAGSAAGMAGMAGSVDSGADTGSADARDSATTDAPDAADARADATTDTGTIDAGVDASVGPDATADAGSDVSVESGNVADAATDVGAEAGGNICTTGAPPVGTTCTDCEAANCAHDPVVQPACSDFANAGDKALCQATLDCARRTNCAAQSVSTCFCGTGVSVADCKATSAAGLCKAQIEAGLKNTDPNFILSNITNVVSPGGAAMSLVLCDHDWCGALNDANAECLPFCK